MRGRRQMLLLLIIMLVVSTSVGGVMLLILYRVSLEHHRMLLIEITDSQAKLIEAVGRFNTEYATDFPGSAFAATLHQIRDAQKRLGGIGETGEFVLSKREGDRIFFLLQRRRGGFNYPPSVPFDADFAEPVRRALSGKRGTVISRGFRGKLTLSAYQPVEFFDLGIVAKVDLSEIRAPFIRAGLVGAGASFALISLGTLLFLRVGNPLLRRIEESEKKYASMFQSTADILLLMTPEGTIFDVNPAASSTYGFSREEFIGRSINEIVHPDHYGAIENSIGMVMEGQTFRREFLHLKRDGTEFPTEVQLSSITHRGRKAVLVAARDISERKQVEQALRASEHKFRELAESVDEVFWVTASDWSRIFYVSPAYERIWGRSAENLYANPHSWVDAVVEEDRNRIVADAEIKSRGDFSQKTPDYRIIRPDGSIRWIQARAFPIRNEQGQIIRITGIAGDITERKLVERALRDSEERYRSLSQNLEQTIQTKVAELQQAESLASIGRLVSVIAHEVRNPLQNINLGIDALKTEVGADEMKQRLLQEIDYGVNLLNITVTELLEYARPLQLQYSLIPSGEIVRQAVKMVIPQPQDITIKMELEEEEKEIPADVPRMIRVLVNIISNAIEAMPDGGTIWIRSEIHEVDGGGHFQLSISDNGPGMSEEQLRRIFEPFFTTKARGTGLGLAICKKIVDAHKGILRIRSKPGEGTTVRITLPTTKSRNND